MMTKMIRPCVLPAKLKNVGILTLLGEEKTDSNDPVVFDAFRFQGLKYEQSTSSVPEEHYLVKIYTSPNSVVVRYAPKENIDVLMRQTRYLIQEALNAPVVATEEVLDGLYMLHHHSGSDFEPQFLVDTQSDSIEMTDDWVNLTPKWAEPFLESRMFPMSDEEEWCYRHYAVANGKTMYKHEWEGYENVVRVLGHKIKANECAKTLEYLLQFTLDGKRKETDKLLGYQD